MTRTILRLILLTICAACLTEAQGSETSKHVPFDEFGGINSEDVKARLDNFAIELQTRNSKKGYIVVWGPQGKGPGTSDGIGDLLKDFLVST